jgi:hypothetical protein
MSTTEDPLADRPSGQGAVTERAIEQRVDRMIAHLDRLLLNRDMSEDDYHKALNDLSLWEEEQILKIRGHEREASDR